MLYHAASASSEVILSRSPTTASSKLFFTPTGGPAPGNASASKASAVSYASCTRAYAARSSSRSSLKSSEERSSSSTRSARRRFASCSVSLRWSAADLPVHRGRLCKVHGDSAGASPCHDTTGTRRSEVDRWLVSEAARWWLISTVRLLASCEVSVRAASICARAGGPSRARSQNGAPSPRTLRPASTGYIPTRLRTLTAPPPHARRAPLAVTTCAPSAAHATAGSTSPSGACSACASPIFVESASPPGTACAALGALFCPARPPRGSTRDPRGAGGPSGPWGDTRTCSACALWPGKERARDLGLPSRLSPPENIPTARARARALRPRAASCRPSASG